jgi:hypothetical protein
MEMADVSIGPAARAIHAGEHERLFSYFTNDQLLKLIEDAANYLSQKEGFDKKVLDSGYQREDFSEITVSKGTGEVGYPYPPWIALTDPERSVIPSTTFDVTSIPALIRDIIRASRS